MATDPADETATVPAKPTAAEKRAAAEQADQRVPRYTRERLLDPLEGPRITGQAYPAIVGGLDGVDGDEFTLAQVNTHIDSFLAHEDTTGQEA